MRGFARLASALNPKSLVPSKEDTMNIRNAATQIADRATTAAKATVGTAAYIGVVGLSATIKAAEAAKGVLSEGAELHREHIAKVIAENDAKVALRAHREDILLRIGDVVMHALMCESVARAVPFTRTEADAFAVTCRKHADAAEQLQAEALAAGYRWSNRRDLRALNNLAEAAKSYYLLPADVYDRVRTAEAASA